MYVYPLVLGSSGSLTCRVDGQSRIVSRPNPAALLAGFPPSDTSLVASKPSALCIFTFSHAEDDEDILDGLLRVNAGISHRRVVSHTIID